LTRFGFEVEFLTGVSVASTPYKRDESEWPPHPDRLFQALVAAWGRNDPPDDGEQAALEWLEVLNHEYLAVSAPPAHPRSVAAAYVPPNDLQTTTRLRADAAKQKGSLAKQLAVIPSLRTNRVARFFPAMVPTAKPAVVRYSWVLDDGQREAFLGHRAALERLTREVMYLGHSHSLVRVLLVDRIDDTAAWASNVSTSLRLPHVGRLQHLRDQFRRSADEGVAVRPRPSYTVRQFSSPGTPELPHTLYDPADAIVFADAGGSAPTLAAFPAVAKRLRDALLGCMPKELPIPMLLSGHDQAGNPSDKPHIAIVPLADVGWEYSRGRLMGIALVWPRGASYDDRRAVLTAIAQFIRADGSSGTLHFGRYGSWSLALEPGPDRQSLRFDRYVRPSRNWGTVLPVVLDRHPKNKPDQRLVDIMLKSCLNVGLPREALDGFQIGVVAYSAHKGAPSVRDVKQLLPSDSPYRTRPMVHLTLSFAQPVSGPLLLGAGRYRGLGLCLPLRTEGF